MEEAKKAFVVDTSIAKSASPAKDEDAATDASLCYQFLLSIFNDDGFHVVMSLDMYAEWDRHVLKPDEQPEFNRHTHQWFVEMVRSDRVIDIGDVRNDKLRKKIHETSRDAGVQEMMRKDYHLLEAALEKDKIVFSRDKKVRRHYRNAAVTVEEIKLIHWANPILPEDEVIAWLENGAFDDPKRQLGFAGT